MLVPPRKAMRYEWLALSLAGVGGVALAVIGGAGSGWARLSNALELLYPHFPGAAAPGTSWEVMVARVILPLIALYATVRFLVSFYSTRIRLARRPRCSRSPARASRGS